MSKSTEIYQRLNQESQSCHGSPATGDGPTKALQAKIPKDPVEILQDEDAADEDPPRVSRGYSLLLPGLLALRLSCSPQGFFFRFAKWLLHEAYCNLANARPESSSLSAPRRAMQPRDTHQTSGLPGRVS